MHIILQEKRTVNNYLYFSEADTAYYKRKRTHIAYSHGHYVIITTLCFTNKSLKKKVVSRCPKWKNLLNKNIFLNLSLESTTHLKHKLTKTICIKRSEIFAFVLIEKAEECINKTFHKNTKCLIQ